ncbi:hypothetical protein RHSIM_Rhsim03G0216100 [Rhododendron simsii]|uniref:Uncharacterized protein n=1 Tax=Rhododendron simsii TaxID=118357 RepID=A0A834H5S4_RHOSS|nr:hypothetical protein RHSIM_Rhsim03G0216100 [Rhododendron simsii]
MDKGEKGGKTAIKSGGARKVLRVKKEVEVNTRENGEREEDCYILDSDPNDSLITIDLSKLSISSDLDATDISVLAEKGQVACRDYPHSRHLCFNNPFEKTPHESYCELCYCFVCDRVAPCKKWCIFASLLNAFERSKYKHMMIDEDDE